MRGSGVFLVQQLGLDPQLPAPSQSLKSLRVDVNSAEAPLPFISENMKADVDYFLILLLFAGFKLFFLSFLQEILEQNWYLVPFICVC